MIHEDSPHRSATPGWLAVRLPVHALWLSLAVLAWFAIAAFAPRFGLLDWRAGLGFMVMTAGPLLLGLAVLVAALALALSLRSRPRGPWWKAALALAIPVIIGASLLQLRATAARVPPIHDVATDVVDPPQFSASTMALRDAAGANPLSPYNVPLGQLPAWQGRVEGAQAIQTHADLIGQHYGRLQPIPTGGRDPAQVYDAIVAAMADIGLRDIRRDPDAGIVEGVARTLAFGFRDDVVVRVRDGRIDLRSASRVGVSDLGYNAARLERLSRAIERRLATP
ncbi:DUF1499 domain-containing protein [Erythrobacteraceae bacterium CFH 75059]|uniref:DUF1499 domain-containing protein n=1 Tax=Qipengyuania thermophila TaxID=2509361 RepID=UPI00101F3B7F|nr:DUF1499 domain-containing protein [Qipengyuania thermophila]TCD02296.1 DUF1499 domain-containing protein [Erythrobacteraceae bacterium CFH 75059]